MTHAEPIAPMNPRTALVLGGTGFIGGFIVAALREAGWRVICTTRTLAETGDDVALCNLAHMHGADDALPFLHNVDAVINVSGILREGGQQTFRQIHEIAPLAFAQACAMKRDVRFVQISALGQPEDGEFIASKHRADAALLGLLPSALVIRPSVVYATSGSYGGTSLLRALAALPLLLPLPGHGQWRLQPIDARDLAELVVAGLTTSTSGCVDAVGPEVLTLEAYQREWRRWLRLPDALAVRTPKPLVDAAVSLAERFGAGPMGRTMWRLLQRGNVSADPNASERLSAMGHPPRSLRSVLGCAPSQTQDRWHAQLYLLYPLLIVALGVVWLLSAWVGWRTPEETILAMVANTPLEHSQPVLLARSAAGLDLLLCLALWSRAHRRMVIALMGFSVLAYTAVFGLAVPQLWLDPLGGLLKNLLVLPALWVAWVLTEKR